MCGGIECGDVEKNISILNSPSLNIFIWSIRMEGYLRGYYWYKNFGDELLFFGIVKQLFSKYPLTKLFVEVENTSWMEDRVWENYQGLLTEKQLKSLKFINARQHKYKIITHVIHFLGRGKYKKIFKFFGWWEVLSDERTFPHDGRNIPLLFNYSVRTGKFALLGGIGKISTPWTEKLYRYLLPKAEKIIVRDRESYTIAKEIGARGKGQWQRDIDNNVVLYQDFAQEIILRNKEQEEIGERDSLEGKDKFGSNLSTPSNSQVSSPYILININRQSVNLENIKKIVDFCNQYPDHKKIYFPCDMNDDKNCFYNIKKYISGLEMYDRTKYSLSHSLSLFYNATGGIGARLHFLLPLKLYEKPIVAIPYADKINKLIIDSKAKI